MRILLIHNYYQYRGGEDVYFDSLTKLLKDKGHEVYTYTKNSSEIKDLKGKMKVAFGMFCNKEVEEELTKIIRNFKPDITHFNNIYPLITPIAYQVCKKFNIPIIQTMHTYRFLCPKGNLFRDGMICQLCIDKRFSYPAIWYGCYHNSRLTSLIFSTSFLYHHTAQWLNLIDKLIFPASHIQEYYLKHTPIALDRTALIPCFIEDIKRPKIFSREKDYFLFLGRLSEEKGILNLLEVFSSLSATKLIVIGDGPLIKQVTKYQKNKNIIIKKYLPQEQVYKYMTRAMFTIIPSTVPWYEVGPLVLYESFANGTPVIAPEAGVFKERIHNKKTGIFYKYNDYDDMREKVLKVIRNKNILKGMSIAARQEYEKKYAPDIHYRSLIQLYESIKI